jgi:membrane dipeptidase
MRRLGSCTTALALSTALAAPALWAAEPPSSGVSTSEAPSREEAARIKLVRRVLEKTPLVDGHNDLPWQIRDRFQGRLEAIDLEDTRSYEPPLHTDLARLRAGGVGAQFWSVYVPVEETGANAVQAVLEQIDIVARMVQRYPETLVWATTADDIERIHRSGRIACLVGVEGGHCIDGSLAVLRQLYACGARYMTLAHSKDTEWVDSATDAPRNGGLGPFGIEVVHEMNRLGMLVDLSHISRQAMHDVLDATRAPIIFSHSSARALCDFTRNVPDDVLVRIPENGGVVMVTFATGFVSTEVLEYTAARKGETARLEALHPEDSLAVETGLAAWKDAHPMPHATLSQVADHIDHIRDTAGIDHVGIGSDFDGITTTPVGLEDVSHFPDLLVELARRGYDAEDLAKVAGGNLLRVMRQVEQVAQRLQTGEGPEPAASARRSGGR